MNTQNVEITRRLDEVLNDLQEKFKGLYYTSDFNAAINALKEAEGSTGRGSKLRDLYKMLDACDIEYERGQNTSYYENLVNGISLPTDIDILDRMLEAMFSIYDYYPTPEIYMKRIVDRLSNIEDDWDDDTLRLRILKQFIKYGNYLPKSGISGRKYIQEYAEKKGCMRSKDREEVVKYLEDDIFSVLDMSLEDILAVTGIKAKSPGKLKKKDVIKDKVEIIKAADDLASGKFRINGTTKQYLYLFAMTYSMTYSSGDDDKLIFDAERDIDKNLFKDYYTNNFVRFITSAYDGKMREYENDPSGQGINYKNYAEMVYLYYISKEDMSPEKKIKKANTMIDSIKTAMLGKGIPERFPNEKRTERLRSYFVHKNEKTKLYSEDILNKDEDEFEEFLCKNYFCDTSGSYEPLGSNAKSIMSPLQLESRQETAYEEYRAIIDMLKSELIKQGDDLEHCNYGLWFTDVAALMKYEDENSQKYGCKDQIRFFEFVKLLRGINDYIGNTMLENESKLSISKENKNRSTVRTKALFITNPEAVTRSAMITAYHYYYNLVHCDDGDVRFKGFENVYNDFKYEIDKHLEKAHYQLFSGKNIFDVAIAFSAYAYINNL